MMGGRRERDVEDFATQLGARLGCLILVENRDLSEDPRDADFLQKRNRDWEMRLIGDCGLRLEVGQ